MGVRTANVQDGNIGETLTGLAEVIHDRRDASPQESYTARLLTDVEDELLKKLAEEASEVIMACNEARPQVAMVFTGQRSFKH